MFNEKIDNIIKTAFSDNENFEKQFKEMVKAMPLISRITFETNKGFNHETFSKSVGFYVLTKKNNEAREVQIEFETKKNKYLLYVNSFVKKDINKETISKDKKFIEELIYFLVKNKRNATEQEYSFYLINTEKGVYMQGLEFENCKDQQVLKSKKEVKLEENIKAFLFNVNKTSNSNNNLEV